MAAETYYFFFSLIFALIALLHTINLVGLRIKSKGIFGLFYKPGTPEYGKLRKIVRNRNIALSVLVTLIFIASLAYSLIRLTELNTPDADFLLFSSPIFAIGIGLGMLALARKESSKYRR